MAQRLYIIPEVTDARGVLVAKYLDSLGPSGAIGQMRYGFQPIRLVGADFTTEQDASLVANPDVYAFPFNLQATVGGGGVQAARNAHEIVLIPAQWINGNMIWMEVAHTDAGMFQYMNRLKTYLPGVFLDSGAKLNAQWSTLPVNVQEAIVACAESFGYSTSFISNNTQVRVILENFANAWGEAPIFVGPIVLQI